MKVSHKMSKTLPKKNFGILPTNGFTLYIIVLVFALVNLFRIVGEAFFEDKNAPGYSSINTIIILVVAFFVSGFFMSNIKYGAILYHNSRRQRYLKSRVIPYFEKKYGVKIETKNHAGYRMVVNHAVKFAGDEKEYVLIGWDVVEESAAKGTAFTFEDSLYIAERLTNGSRELKLADHKEGDERSTFSLVKESSDLSGTEKNISELFHGIMFDLPEGRQTLQVIPPEKMEFPGLKRTLKVNVDFDGLQFARKDLQELIDAAIFNIQLGGSSFLLIQANSGDKHYILGKMLFSGNHNNLTVEALTNVIGNEKNIHYAEDLKSLGQ